jgi:hypothetical protein
MSAISLNSRPRGFSRLHRPLQMIKGGVVIAHSLAGDAQPELDIGIALAGVDAGEQIVDTGKNKLPEALHQRFARRKSLHERIEILPVVEQGFGLIDEFDFIDGALDAALPEIQILQPGEYGGVIEVQAEGPIQTIVCVSQSTGSNQFRRLGKEIFDF